MLMQIRHLVGYDVRAVRIPLLVWALVLATQAALLLIGPAGLGVSLVSLGPSRGAGLGYGVLVVRLALTAILVALVVERDPLVGTTAFWRTRPIPRRRLLASKVVTILLLVVLVPGVVTFAVLVALGVPLPAAARGALSVGLEQAVVATFALAAAALTANLAHFVIAAFAGLTFVMTVLAILPFVATSASWPRDLAMGWASGVFSAIAGAGAVAAVVHQFLTLRTGRSAAVMASLLVVATVTGVLWHPLEAERDARPVSASLLTPDALSVQVNELRWQSSRSVREGVPEERRILWGEIRPDGEPDAILLALDSFDLSLRYAGRSIAEHGYDARRISRVAGAEDRLIRSVRAAIGGGGLTVRPSLRVLTGGTELLAAVPADVAAGVTGGSGVIDATVRFRAFRYVVTARAGLAVGNSLTTAAQHSTIAAIGPVASPRFAPADADRPGVDILLRCTVVGPTPWLGGSLTGFFILHNEARRQAVFLSPWGFGRFTPVVGLVSLRAAVDVWTGLQHLEFDESRWDPGFPVNDDWLRGAELLLVEPEELGVVTRPLRVEGVPAPGGA